MVLDVQTSAYTDAAGALGDGAAEQVGEAWSVLQAGLASTYGMAGSDESGAAWGFSYDNAAAMACSATEDVINACYRLAALLEQTGLNYGEAEAASAPGIAGQMSRNRWAGSSVSLSGVPPAIGGGSVAPPGWALLQHAIGRLWPDGHQDLLHAAAQTWRRAQDQVLWLQAEVDRAVVALVGQRSPERADAVTVIQAMRSHLAELAATYAGIGAACSAYAHHLDQAHHQIIAQLQDFVEVSAAIEAAGALIAVVTAGVSELAAQGGEAAEIARAASAIRSIIDVLAAVAEQARVAIDAVSARLLEIVAKVRPILARNLEQVRLAAASDRGEIIFGRQAATDAADSTAAATTPERAALARLDDATEIGPANETWADKETLNEHFRKHGKKIGASSQEDYARKAALFFRRALREKLPMKRDLKDGTVRFYDRESNIFGAYRLDGKTRTYFMPKSGEKYWENQGGVLTNG